jgi:predicted small metal-binding protein
VTSEDPQTNCSVIILIGLPEVHIEAKWEAMMKAMHCGDLMKGCDFVARGASEDEVMKKAAEHAKSAHGIDNITPELAQKVKAAIKDE